MRSQARGNRILSFTLALLCGFAAAGFARAEDEAAQNQLMIECSANPSPAVFSRDVTVSLDIANMGDKKVHDIQVFRGGDMVDEVLELGRGESAAVTDEMAMTNEQIAEGKITYRLAYNVDAQDGKTIKREQYAYASVDKKKAVPKVEFTRTLSSTHVKKGGEVTVTYRLRNTGDIALLGVVLTDDLCGEVGTLEVLEPGERESFVQKVKIQKTSISRPTLTYHCEGMDEATEQLKAATIYLANEQLDRLLAADKTTVAPGELVTLRLSLNNQGNVAYEDLKIADQSLGEIGVISGELKPGEEYTFVKTVTLKTTTTFQFEITGKSSNGTEIVESSNMLTVSVSPVVDNVRLRVNADAMPDYLLGPGTTTFDITIENDGDVDIRNAVLAEQTLGDLKNLAVLAPGATTVEYPLEVRENGSYVFMVRVTDANQEHVTVLSEPVSVVVEESGEGIVIENRPAEGTVLPRLVGTPRKLDPSKYYEQMILWALLVLSVLVLLLLYAFTGKRRRRHRRKKRLDRIDNSDNPEFVNTKPHPPVGKN